MGFGAFAGGLGQGIMQGRQMALQQAYMKQQMQLQQAHQAMLEKQMQFNQQRTAQQDMARPLEDLAKRVPRQAGAIGPAIEGIYSGGDSAKYNPTMQDQTAPAPDPMSLERPEQQPITGYKALAPLMANAYAAAGRGAQEEYDADRKFKEQMALNAQQTRDMLAQSLIGHRNELERQGRDRIDLGAGHAQGKNKLTSKELDEIRKIMDYRDTAYTALNLVNDPSFPKGGELRTWVSEQGGRVGAALGMDKGPMEDPALNAANKYFRQNLYKSEYGMGGVRMAASPQMFENNKTTFANPQYMNHETLRRVATQSVNAADASLENVKDILRQKGIPEEEWGKYLRELRTQSPEEIIHGKKRSPAQVMGSVGDKPPVPTNVPMQPPPDLFQPGWR